MRARPTVPAVDQEDPVAREMRAQMMMVAARKYPGPKIFNP